MFSKNFKKFTPLLNRVLVRKLKPETKTKSGIFIQGNDNSNVGVIVSIGEGLKDKGNLIPMNLKLGDYVLLPDFDGSKIELGDGEFHLFRDSDILGVLDGKSE